MGSLEVRTLSWALRRQAASPHYPKDAAVAPCVWHHPSFPTGPRILASPSRETLGGLPYGRPPPEPEKEMRALTEDVVNNRK